MTLTLPFVHLNLRWNPFGEPPREERAALAVVDLPELRPGDPVQFVGEGGRGKTTHLLALAALHPGAMYECVAEGSDRLEARVPDGSVYLVDEAQRVRRDRLTALLRRPLALAFGTHLDLSPMRTVRVGSLGPDTLRRIFERRIEWARRGSGPIPRIPPQEVQRLLDRYGDDLRAMEGHLYDRFQALEEPVDVFV